MAGNLSTKSLNLESLTAEPRISVVITTYDEEIYDDFAACVESVLGQSYDHFEVVIVTETEHADKNISDDFGDHDRVNHVHSAESLNLASARNLGAKHATGDVYAFIDDDAIAESGWLEAIAKAYLRHDAFAVGGKLIAEWPDDVEPALLTPEFYWLVGVTHRGFRENAGPVRNTFGANITFRAQVFDSLGGFDTGFGKDHGHNLQGEETDLCARMYAEYDRMLHYEPEAVVRHRVYDWQLQWSWLFDRAFWQGYSKWLLKRSVPDSTGTERSFLRSLFTDSLPHYARLTISERSLKPAGCCLMAFLLTFVVGVGFVIAAGREFTQ